MIKHVKLILAAMSFCVINLSAAILDDDFDSGLVGGWSASSGSFSMTNAYGEDGLLMQDNSNTEVTHSSLQGLTDFSVSVDFLINDSANGDFNILMRNGNDSSEIINIGTFVVGSDTAISNGDYLSYRDNGSWVFPDSRASIVTNASWHNLEVTRDSTTGLVDVKLDGQAWLSETNIYVGESMDLSFRGYAQGVGDEVMIDNVLVTSTASAVPEPATSSLLALGLVGLIGLQRRRK